MRVLNRRKSSFDGTKIIEASAGDPRVLPITPVPIISHPAVALFNLSAALEPAQPPCLIGCSEVAAQPSEIIRGLLLSL